jgi:hypothetical protein
VLLVRNCRRLLHGRLLRGPPLLRGLLMLLRRLRLLLLLQGLLLQCGSCLRGGVLWLCTGSPEAHVRLVLREEGGRLLPVRIRRGPCTAETHTPLPPLP